jgi:hypothetical protein
MSEASLSCFPAQLGGLFAIILTTCGPSNPKTLWEKYKENLTEDVLRQLHRENPTMDLNFSPDIFNQALILLEDNRSTFTLAVIVLVLLHRVTFKAPDSHAFPHNRVCIIKSA